MITDIHLQVEAAREPGRGELLRILEKYMEYPKVRVLTCTETMICPVCGERAEITTHWGTRRKRWYEFWLLGFEPEYHFTSTHPCYTEAAKKYADADGPWARTA